MEQVFFFGDPGSPMWGVLYQPQEPAGGSWLLCAPLGDERGHSQRVMVEWARTLARRGYAVMRFDYRGSGNSGGLQEQFSIDDHLADIYTAVHELERRTGRPLLGFCGLRLGATMATKAAAQINRTCRLILWEPIENGAALANEIVRMAAATQMTHGGSASRQTPREFLAGGGRLVTRGHTVTARILDDIERLSLAEHFPANCPAQIVAISPNPDRIDQIRQGLASATRIQVQLEQIDIPLPWTETKEYNVRPQKLFSLSLEWIEQQNRPQTPPEGTGRPPAVQSDQETNETTALEQPVSFLANGCRLFGVFHKPDRSARARPVVLLPWMSTQFYVTLARYLAARGWPVLRYDPHGKGDSEGHYTFQTLTQLWNATERGLLAPDAAAAIDFVAKELHYPDVILAGVCGDAITAALLGAQDSRVAGTILLDLPMVFTLPGGITNTLMAMRRRLLKSPNRLYSAMVTCIDVLWKLNRATREKFANLVAAVRRRVTASRQAVSWTSTALGAQANTKVLDAIALCLRRHTPVLCIFAPRRNWMLFRNVVAHLSKLAQRQEDFEYHVIPKADHVFSLPEHTRQAAMLCSEWLEHAARPWNASAPPQPKQERGA